MDTEDYTKQLSGDKMCEDHIGEEGQAEVFDKSDIERIIANLDNWD